MKTSTKSLFTITSFLFLSNVLDAQTCGTSNVTYSPTSSSNFLPKWNATAGCISNSLIYDNATNIGIGTSSPGGLLQLLNVTHTSPTTGYTNLFAGTLGFMFRIYGDSYIYGNSYYNSSGHHIYASDNGAGTSGGASSISFNATAPGNIDFYTAPYGTAGSSFSYTNRMTILQAGNVGIGTTTPQGKLEVQSGAVNNTPDNVSALMLTRNTGATSPRRIYMIPHLGAGALNGITRSGDIGLFWTDGTQGAGTSGNNGTAGFVIAPFGGSNNGMRITPDGNVGIGVALDVNPNTYKLAVNGTIGAKAVKVEISSTTWADYVFEKEYKLKTIKELEAFINVNKHLPNIPTAGDVQKDGIDMATMNAKFLEKIEELSLYIIEQNKRIEILEQKISTNTK